MNIEDNKMKKCNTRIKMFVGSEYRAPYTVSLEQRVKWLEIQEKYCC